MVRKAMVLLAAISFVGAMVAATQPTRRGAADLEAAGAGLEGAEAALSAEECAAGSGVAASEAGLPVLASGAPVSAEISSARGSHASVDSVVAASGSASRRSSSARGSTPGPTTTTTTTDAEPTHRGVPATSAAAGADTAAWADMATTRSGHSTTG
jgi:hypothetical protein